jgi:hypothetical protein
MPTRSTGWLRSLEAVPASGDYRQGGYQFPDVGDVGRRSGSRQLTMLTAVKRAGQRELFRSGGQASWAIRPFLGVWGGPVQVRIGRPRRRLAAMAVTHRDRRFVAACGRGRGGAGSLVP